MSDGFPLDGHSVSDDEVMRRVIDAQAREREARRELTALRADRNQLLEEYTDMRRARPVPRAPSKPKTSARADLVSVSAGDVHGMYQDPEAVTAFIDDIAKLRPGRIVLGGDILECGGWLAKHQPVGFVALTDYSYQEDIKAGNDLLDRLQEAAPDAEIIYIEGNHEARPERTIIDVVRAHSRDAEFLRKAFAPDVMLRLEERGIKYYRCTECYGDGLPLGWIKLGKMYYTHMLGKSQNAARDSVARAGGNVTFFHTHRSDSATLVLPSVGICKAFNPGCLCKRQPIWQTSNPTLWSHGYAIDIVAKSGNFQHIQVPIWNGDSLAGAMIECFNA